MMATQRSPGAGGAPGVDRFAGALLGLAVGDALGRPAEGRGLGVGGMTISLLLIAAYLFLHTGGDYLRAVEGAIGLGGDTDGTAATAGALCAAWRGAGVVPRDAGTARGTGAVPPAAGGVVPGVPNA